MSKQEYPKWLFGAGGVSIKVADADAHGQLGVGWYESPADVPDAADQPGSPIAVTADGAEPTESEKAAALYKAPVKAIVERLAGASRAVIDEVLRLEQANPKGARKGVLAAARALLDDATKVAE